MIIKINTYILFSKQNSSLYMRQQGQILLSVKLSSLLVKMISISCTIRNILDSKRVSDLIEYYSYSLTLISYLRAFIHEMIATLNNKICLRTLLEQFLLTAVILHNLSTCIHEKVLAS